MALRRFEREEFAICMAKQRLSKVMWLKRTYKTNKMERLEKYGLKTSFDDIFTLNFVFLHVLVFMEVIN